MNNIYGKNFLKLGKIDKFQEKYNLQKITQECKLDL